MLRRWIMFLVLMVGFLPFLYACAAPPTGPRVLVLP
jgi:hypothetical protein